MSQSESKTTLIYALADPYTGDVRYVGKTTRSLRTRLTEHVRLARNGLKRHVCNWIRSLGESPKIVLLTEVHGGGDWAGWERFWISWFPRLTNHTSGGEGTVGRKMTARSRAILDAMNAERSAAGNVSYSCGWCGASGTKKLSEARKKNFCSNKCTMAHRHFSARESDMNQAIRLSALGLATKSIASVVRRSYALVWRWLDDKSLRVAGEGYSRASGPSERDREDSSRVVYRDRPRSPKGPIKVVGAGDAPIHVIEDRTESSDADQEATGGS